MTNDVPSRPEPEKRPFQEWAEQSVRDNPPPPLANAQRDILDVLGRHLLSDSRWSSQTEDDDEGESPHNRDEPDRP